MQKNTLIIDHYNLAAPVEEVADLIGFDQGPCCGGQRDDMRKSALLEIILDRDIIHTAIQNGMGNYAMLPHF